MLVRKATRATLCQSHSVSNICFGKREGAQGARRSRAPSFLCLLLQVGVPAVVTHCVAGYYLLCLLLQVSVLSTDFTDEHRLAFCSSVQNLLCGLLQTGVIVVVSQCNDNFTYRQIKQNL